MKMVTYPLRSTQTLSLAELLRELHFTLLLTAGRQARLAILGADQDGLIKLDTSLSGIKVAAGNEKKVAVWGNRRLELLSRSQLLKGKIKNRSGHLLPWGKKTKSPHPDSPVSLQWSSNGLWGADRAGYGVLDRNGNFTGKKVNIIQDRSKSILSGMALENNEPAYLTRQAINKEEGCILHAGNRSEIMTGLEMPTSPLLIDSTLYILEGPSGRIVSCDMLRGTKTSVVLLPGPANSMIRFGNHLLISLSGPNADICCLNLDDGRLKVLRESPFKTNIYLHGIIPGLPQRARNRTAAYKAASVAAVTGMILTQSPLPTIAADAGNLRCDTNLGMESARTTINSKAKDIIFTIPSPLGDVNDLLVTDPAFADIDGDGDFDAFIGEAYGTVRYFENTGTKTASAFIERAGSANPLNAVNVTYLSSPTFVDIDGDGDLDSFIGNYYGIVHFFENTGTSTAPSFTERTGTANPLNNVLVAGSSSPDFVDIDGDGDFDAFIGVKNGIIHYFENTGTNTTPIFTERTGTTNPLNSVDVGDDSIPAFVDIDDDGDFDAFIGEQYGTIHHFENTGTNTAPTFVERTGSQNLFDGVRVQYLSTPTFVDIDGDGDFDTFTGEYYGAITAFRNDGTPAAPNMINWDIDSPLSDVRVNYLSTPTFVDIDGDGDSDAFIGEAYGTVRYFENTGTNTAPMFTERTGTANPLNGIEVDETSAPAFVDIDGDGDFDVFIGELYGTIKYFENTGTSAAPLFTEHTDFHNPLLGIRVDYLSSPSFVDIDGDGDFDVFIGEYYGNISHFENIGTNTEPAFFERTVCDNPLYGVSTMQSAPTFVDIDGDGDYDAFVGEKYGTVRYYENIGSKTNPNFIGLIGPYNPLRKVNVFRTSFPTFVDIDGDGDFDAFIGEYFGTIEYWRNDTPQKKFPWHMFMPAITGHLK